MSFSVGGGDVFACAVDDNRFVYRDVARAARGVSRAHRMSGQGDRDLGALPTCATRMVPGQEQTSLEVLSTLDPVPALESGGQWRVAVPVSVSA